MDVFYLPIKQISRFLCWKFSSSCQSLSCRYFAKSCYSPAVRTSQTLL